LNFPDPTMGRDKCLLFINATVSRIMIAAETAGCTVRLWFIITEKGKQNSKNYDRFSS
jgi:hypothetical protein